jgi:hypothetical protein
MESAMRARDRWLWFGAWYLFFVLGYLTAGQFPLAAPRLAPQFAWEPLPFKSWAIWIYLSHFLLVILATALVKERSAFMGLIKRKATATALAFGVFFAWPTTLPRMVQNHGGLTGKAWSLLYETDVPANCLPSLHVALACICLHAIGRGRSPVQRVFLILWGVGITLSTLLTGQHVLLDAVAGAALGLLVVLALPTTHEVTEAGSRQGTRDGLRARLDQAIDVSAQSKSHPC